MRVLIVEDEKHERVFLEKLLRQELPDPEIKIATGGNSFFQIAMEWDPDLVFLDIRIPDQNGLDVLEILRKKGFRGYVVVLSAYDFFEYAQSSVKLGVSHYILKPASREEIRNILGKIGDRIREKDRRNESSLALKAFIEENRGEAFRSIIEKLIIEECLSPEDHGILAEIGFPSEKKASLIGIFLLNQTGNRWGNISIREKIKERMPAEIIQIPWKFYMHFLVVPYETNLSVEQTTLDLVELLREKDYPVNIIYEEKISGIEELAQVIQLMEAELEDSVLKDTGLICSREDLGKRQEDIGIGGFQDRQRIIRRREHVLELFKNSLNVQLETELWDFFTETVQSMGLPLACLILRELLLEMIDHCFVANCPESKILHAGNRVISSMFIDKATAMARKEITEIVRDIVEIKKQSTEKSTAVIVDVIEYIHSNLDSVNLENAAGHVNVSPQYLSRLFHTISGRRFIDVIKEIRIENAKRLLKEGYSVKQVAIAVGYGNISYFSLIFKNYVGIPPRDFAKSSETEIPPTHWATWRK